MENRRGGRGRWWCIVQLHWSLKCRDKDLAFELQTVKEWPLSMSLSSFVPYCESCMILFLARPDKSPLWDAFTYKDPVCGASNQVGNVFNMSKTSGGAGRSSEQGRGCYRNEEPTEACAWSFWSRNPWSHDDVGLRWGPICTHTEVWGQELRGSNNKAILISYLGTGRYWVLRFLTLL